MGCFYFGLKKNMNNYSIGMDGYVPDCWVILKFTGPEYGVIHKVLAGGGGGYLNGYTWKLNSGITKVEVDNDPKGRKFYIIHGISGSRYFCYEDRHGLKMSIAPKYSQFKKALGDCMQDFTDFDNITEKDWGK